jgi:hypothetical protein
LRPGYDPIYHTGSELELGARGWIQRANFIVMSAGMFASRLASSAAWTARADRCSWQSSDPD